MRHDWHLLGILCNSLLVNPLALPLKEQFSSLSGLCEELATSTIFQTLSKLSQHDALPAFGELGRHLDDADPRDSLTEIRRYL